MARPREKSQSLFSQWNSLVSKESVRGKKEKEQRPGHTSDCSELTEAEKWRKEVVRDASQRVYWISNAGLGEQQIRDMNDEINKLIKIKGHWDRRIVELGGDNYAKVKQQLDVEGKELPGVKGYKYYGAAMDLPGIREKFEKAEKENAQTRRKENKRARKELVKYAGEEYYGTEACADLEAAELEREKHLVSERIHQFDAVKRRNMSNRNSKASKATYPSDEEEEELHAFLEGKSGITSNVISNGSIGSAPSRASGVQTEVANMLLETKKSALLGKYA